MSRMLTSRRSWRVVKRLTIRGVTPPSLIGLTAKASPTRILHLTVSTGSIGMLRITLKILKVTLSSKIRNSSDPFFRRLKIIMSLKSRKRSCSTRWISTASSSPMSSILILLLSVRLLPQSVLVSVISLRFPKTLRSCIVKWFVRAGLARFVGRLNPAPYTTYRGASLLVLRLKTSHLFFSLIVFVHSIRLKKELVPPVFRQCLPIGISVT